MWISPETLETGTDPDPEDPYMPLKYECTVLHVSLASLDLLTDRRLVPQSFAFEEVARAQKDAFATVARIRTGTQLGVVTLQEGYDIVEGRVNGSTVAVVKRPNTIIIQDLSTPVRTTLVCPNSEFYPLNRVSGLSSLFALSGADARIF